MPIRETTELLQQLILLHMLEEIVKGDSHELLPLAESLREVSQADSSERWRLVANLLSTAADVSRRQQE